LGWLPDIAQRQTPKDVEGIQVLEARICAIGLDIGGTKIAGGLVALPSGQVLAKRVIPAQPKRGGPAVLADTLVLAEALLREAHTRELEVLGIGLGVAELVDPEGNITSTHTFPWRGVPMQATFARLAPAIVESDVRAAALAEATFGAGRAFSLFAYVTVGTGISYSLVQEGRPYTGARGNALVLASSPLTTICTECGAVLRPVLDEIAAGPALVNYYNQRCPDEPLAQGEAVLAAARAGHAIAVQVVETAGAALGVSVGFLVNVLDPEAIIVGGGLGLAGGLYWDSFVASTRSHIWSDTNQDLPILPAALGVDAGLIGAATAVWQKWGNWGDR
jgi:glucokinase